ncbi:TetR family transcriptional regulator [Sphingobium yanoikuyae]|uniref:TetR/AcrR family transcriptional regulator n=1 Tax=Sphingobium yanoikuyae TaxID=13690 RepID=A0A3G2V6X4_SPHYA|nr:TetR/AcrR family transcriptional regulator [Sphingobium yanoikuyae]AYO80269.1 TetR/AcrR family transcriptional regulator [Sphingobium yanoikuyae]KZC80568.1 TetR family transcriptional regulator [Sphingobium yanoikuyae]
MTDETAQQRRYKSFEDTHQMLIELAVGLIADRGIDALSLSALARAAGVNRTTIYYHFTDRDALVAAVKLWSSQQIVAAFRPELPRQARIDYVTRFVLDNPAIMSLWIEDFIAPGDIRASYPHWDALVSGIGTSLAAAFPDEAVDAEVYCVMLLTSALIGPRVFRHRVAPDLDTEATIARFRQEQQRVLRRDGIADD